MGKKPKYIPSYATNGFYPSLVINFTLLYWTGILLIHLLTLFLPTWLVTLLGYAFLMTIATYHDITDHQQIKRIRGEQ